MAGSTARLNETKRTLDATMGLGACYLPPTAPAATITTATSVPMVNDRVDFAAVQVARSSRI